MCVVAIADKVRLTEEQTEKMFNANSAGGGVAWRELDKKDGKVYARWEKGLDLHQMQEIIKNLPLPFVAHFRIPTVGGAVPELCHPFVINKKGPNELSGKTTDHLLFHNGHWADWKKTSMELAVKSKVPLPSGKWSDTRAMAWVASLCGPGVLDFIDEKVVIFGPSDIDLCGVGWTRVEDVVVSNTGWNICTTSYGRGWQQRQANRPETIHVPGTVDSRLPHVYRPEQKALPPASSSADESKVEPSTKETGKAGGASHPLPFRPTETDVRSGGNQQESVQEGTTQAGKVAAQGGEGSQEASHSPLRPTSATDEMKRWTVSLNPKVYHSVTPAPRTRAVLDLTTHPVRLTQMVDDADEEADKIRTGMLGPGA